MKNKRVFYYIIFASLFLIFASLFVTYLAYSGIKEGFDENGADKFIDTLNKGVDKFNEKIKIIDNFGCPGDFIENIVRINEEYKNNIKDEKIKKQLNYIEDVKNTLKNNLQSLFSNKIKQCKKLGVKEGKKVTELMKSHINFIEDGHNVLKNIIYEKINKKIQKLNDIANEFRSKFPPLSNLGCPSEMTSIEGTIYSFFDEYKTNINNTRMKEDLGFIDSTRDTFIQKVSSLKSQIAKNCRKNTNDTIQIIKMIIKFTNDIKNEHERLKNIIKGVDDPPELIGASENSNTTSKKSFLNDIDPEIKNEIKSKNIVKTIKKQLVEMNNLTQQIIDINTKAVSDAALLDATAAAAT